MDGTDICIYIQTKINNLTYSPLEHRWTSNYLYDENTISSTLYVLGIIVMSISAIVDIVSQY